MKVVIPGGSGQVGTILARCFHANGHDVVVLSRRPDESAVARRCSGTVRPPAVGDGRSMDAMSSINLAGAVSTAATPRRIAVRFCESRLQSTRVVGEAIAQAAVPPRVWLQASTATIYAHRYDGPNDESAGVLGGHESDAPSAWRFSIDVARAWERTFDDAVTNRTRKVRSDRL